MAVGVVFTVLKGLVSSSGLIVRLHRSVSLVISVRSCRSVTSFGRPAYYVFTLSIDFVSGPSNPWARSMSI